MTTLGLDMAAFGMGMLPISIIQRENTNKPNNNIEHSVQIMNGQMGDISSAAPTVQQHMASPRSGSCTNHSVIIQNCGMKLNKRQSTSLPSVDSQQE